MEKYLASIMAFAFIAVVGLSSVASAGDAAKGEALFRSAKCKTCHKLTAKKLVGPGLAGVTSRQTDEWLTTWLGDPQGTWSADPQAPGTTQLKQWKKGKAKKKKTAMKIRKLNPDEIADLIAFLHTK